MIVELIELNPFSSCTEKKERKGCRHDSRSYVNMNSEIIILSSDDAKKDMREEERSSHFPPFIIFFFFILSSHSFFLLLFKSGMNIISLHITPQFFSE